MTIYCDLLDTHLCSLYWENGEIYCSTGAGDNVLD